MKSMVKVKEMKLSLCLFMIVFVCDTDNKTSRIVRVVARAA